MKQKLTTIAMVVSIILNVLQFASKEAREWYVAVKVNAKPSESVNLAENKMKYVEKHNTLDKPGGAQ